MENFEVYLDNAVVARPSDKVVSAMAPFLGQYWGALTAPHKKGQELFPFLEEMYRRVYTLFNGSGEDTFILTSSGAEAVNHVIESAYRDITLAAGKNHFITLANENAPTMLSIGRLEKQGCVGKMIELDDDGIATAEALGDAITPRTALVSMSWAHGLTGVVQPISEISDVCKERGVLFHLDVTHALGKLYFELDDLGADILTFNGSQLHTPKGVGGIYLREGIELSPWILGGADQGGYRAGDLDLPALAALGEAAVELLEVRDYVCTEIARLRDLFEERVVSRVLEAVVFFKDQERLPHCSTIGFPGTVNEVMLFALNRKGVFANIGGGHFQQLKIILSASGFDETLAQTAISFTLSRETTEEQILAAADVVVETAVNYRKLSKNF